MTKKYKKVRKEEMIVMADTELQKVVNGNLEAALKFWKRQVKESGILQEVKDRREYIKPSAVRRKQKQDAIRKEYIRRLREQN